MKHVRYSSPEAEALLTSEPLIAHLATCTENDPHVAPLWYNYRDGHIEIVTTEQKLANIRVNPRVALSVRRDEDGHGQWGVSLRRTATVIEDEDRIREATRRINRRYGVEEDSDRNNATYRAVSAGNCNRTGRSLEQRLWPIMLTISKLRCRSSDSDFRCVATGIGMLSNVFLER